MIALMIFIFRVYTADGFNGNIGSIRQVQLLSIFLVETCGHGDCLYSVNTSCCLSDVSGKSDDMLQSTSLPATLIA